MNLQSIKAKLKNYSTAQKKIHQFTIPRFFQERFLYRLSKSTYRDNFLLKGGALVYTYGVEDSRYTKDIDFLAVRISAEFDDLSSIFKEISGMPMDDGVEFDPSSIKLSPISKEGLYSGIRIQLKGVLGNINQYLQIDVGVGDSVTPGPEEIVYPTILEGFASPILKAYSLENLIAEKFEAMISLGEYNTRMKDFYDVFKLVERTDEKILEEAVRNSFARRSTKLSTQHPIFDSSFYQDGKRIKQWKVFLKKNEFDKINFSQVGVIILRHLKGIYEDLTQ